MTPERHERLMSLFDEACDLDREGQAAAVARLGAEDSELAQALAALLRHDRTRGHTRGGAGSDLLDAGIAAAVSALPMLPTAAPFTLSPEDAAGIFGPGPEGPEVEILALLGEGGMGRVMLARQRSLRREVAAKVLKPEAASLATAAGLVSEGLLLAALEHPNIVPVHVLLRDERGLPLLLMKRVEGVPWSTLINQPEHPAWAGIQRGGGDRLVAHLSILGSVCDALRFAHSRGVIHRDVKPDNVMVGPFGEVYLLDWGIAARTEEEEPAGQGQGQGQGQVKPGRIGVSGTPAYMAPEMLDSGGAAPDERIDVYLLGATLHYVLTRTPRHRGRTLEETLQAARASLPHPYGPEVPEELAALCNRATSADPAARPQSAQAFREAVEGYLRHRDAAALGEAAEERLLQALALAKDQDKGKGKDPARRRRAQELMTECHFGFRQSLRAWPENPQALRGLRRCLSVLIEEELAQGSLARAESLLEEMAELGPPPQDLLARAAALREQSAAREAREARLREIERGQDWSIAARQRTIFGLLATALAVLVWRLSVRDQAAAPHPIPPLLQALYMGCGGAGVALLVALFRRQLLTTAVNRDLLIFVLFSVTGMTVNRALHALPATTTASAVAMDQVLAATSAAIAAATLIPWVWGIVPIFLCGALAARLFPSWAGACFATSFLLSAALTLTLTWRRTHRRSRGGAAVP